MSYDIIGELQKTPHFSTLNIVPSEAKTFLAGMGILDSDCVTVKIIEIC